MTYDLKRGHMLTILVLLASADIGGFSWAQYPEPSSLRKLDTVYLKVTADAPARIPMQPITELVEQKLKQAGIIVLVQKDQAQPPPDASILRLAMTFTCDVHGLCGYVTSLELWQRVQLTREQSISVMAITWRDSYTLGISKADLPALPIQFDLDARTLVNAFTKDYLTVNPR
jgi:hypothetical protein